jgi:hypothetical protein
MCAIATLSTPPGFSTSITSDPLPVYTFGSGAGVAVGVGGTGEGVGVGGIGVAVAVGSGVFVGSGVLVGSSVGARVAVGSTVSVLVDSALACSITAVGLEAEPDPVSISFVVSPHAASISAITIASRTIPTRFIMCPPYHFNYSTLSSH